MKKSIYIFAVLIALSASNVRAIELRNGEVVRISPQTNDNPYRYTVVGKLGEGGYAVVYHLQRLADGVPFLPKRFPSADNIAVKVHKANRDTNISRIIAFADAVGHVIGSEDSYHLISQHAAQLEHKESRTNTSVLVSSLADGNLGLTTHQKALLSLKSDNFNFLQNRSSADSTRLKSIVDETWRLFHDLSIGKTVLARSGIVHGDIKTANIVRIGSSFALIDFEEPQNFLGVSEVNSKDSFHFRARTPTYAAPEIRYHYSRPSTTIADEWSTGMTLLSFITVNFWGLEAANQLDNFLPILNNQGKIAHWKNVLTTSNSALLDAIRSIEDTDTKYKLDSLRLYIIASLQPNPMTRKNTIERLFPDYPVSPYFIEPTFQGHEDWVNVFNPIAADLTPIDEASHGYFKNQNWAVPRQNIAESQLQEILKKNYNKIDTSIWKKLSNLWRSICMKLPATR